MHGSSGVCTRTRDTRHHVDYIVHCSRGRGRPRSLSLFSTLWTAAPAPAPRNAHTHALTLASPPPLELTNLSSSANLSLPTSPRLHSSSLPPPCPWSPEFWAGFHHPSVGVFLVGAVAGALVLSAGVAGREANWPRPGVVTADQSVEAGLLSLYPSVTSAWGRSWCEALLPYGCWAQTTASRLLLRLVVRVFNKKRGGAP